MQVVKVALGPHIVAAFAVDVVVLCTNTIAVVPLCGAVVQPLYFLLLLLLLLLQCGRWLWLLLPGLARLWEASCTASCCRASAQHSDLQYPR
jgi:hypothetical protein